MAHWQEELNIEHLHRLLAKGSIKIEGLARAIVARLKDTEGYAQGNPELVEIIFEFTSLDRISTLADYKVALDLLYDYGDKGRRLWIETEKEAGNTSASNIHSSSAANEEILASSVMGARNGYRETHNPHRDEYKNISSGPSNSSSSSSSSRRRHETITYTTTVWELDQKLKTRNIDKAKISNELYDCMRQNTGFYLEWLLENCGNFTYVEVSKGLEQVANVR